MIVQIGELKPATSYVFLVRAENAHGLSVPSPLSNAVKTVGIGSNNVPQTALAAARIVLSGKVSPKVASFFFFFYFFMMLNEKNKQKLHRLTASLSRVARVTGADDDDDVAVSH